MTSWKKINKELKRLYKKYDWFNPLVLILFIIFFVSLFIVIAIYGFERAFAESWKIILGFSFTSILLYFIEYYTRGLTRGKK